jgi:iron-sulfur cluster assembly accessory protein
MMETKQKIDREMTIEQMLSTFPGKAQKLAHELSRMGLQCVGCNASTWETIEGGVLGHGFQEKDVQKLLERLNKILEEEIDPDAITLTPAAAEKYREILEEEGKQGYGLRLTEKLAGCSGYEYVLDFAEKALDADLTYISQGINVYIRKEQKGRLIGSEIHYKDGLQDAGFIVTNPNVRSSCGCGSSHGYNE